MTKCLWNFHVPLCALQITALSKLVGFSVRGESWTQRTLGISMFNFFKKSKVVKGNSHLIIEDLISQSLILQELETPPGWDYHSGSAWTMKSIKHTKMYKCWHWLCPVLSPASPCPLTAVSSVPPPAGQSGTPKKVNPSRLLQNIFE